MKTENRKLTRVELFWAQDDDAPTCREHYSDGHEESFGVEHCGWSEGEADGDALFDYFTGPDGAYIGPDCYGVYPHFDIKSADDRASRGAGCDEVGR